MSYSTRLGEKTTKTDPVKHVTPRWPRTLAELLDVGRGVAELPAPNTRWSPIAAAAVVTSPSAELLDVEHRAEPSHDPIPVQLAGNGAALALTTEAAAPSSAPADPEPPATPAQRIATALTNLDGAVTLDQLRRACRMRTQTLCDALAELVHAGRVLKSEAGYRLA